MTKPAGGGQMTGVFSPYLERVRNARIATCIPDGSAVLDVGCGRGALLDALRRQGKGAAEYLGIDIDAACIAANRHRHPGARFETADVREFCHGAHGAFDVIAMAAVVEHFDDPAAMLRRYRDCLRPGGRIVLTTPKRGVEGILAAGSRIGLFSREAHEEHRDVLLGRADIRKLAEDCGLRMERYRTFLFGMNQLAIFGSGPGGRS